MRSTNFTLYPSDAPHIARLTKEHATVLAMFRENRNYEALAQAIGVPVGTIKSRLNRARAKVVEFRAQASQAGEAA
jgi:DNA-directed RNA polymerase specialized sigma24 family protein